MGSDGNDTAVGTNENPVSSDEKAQELAEPFFDKSEVNIIFEDEIYHLPQMMTIHPWQSGNSAHPVIYMAVNDGKVVI